ncbi:hypothetical protein [Streptomyces mirabilis]|uniref:hypothetical protein n=1 Tax=Streptomyces mirabilis TaxID=68239 RepID=UPI003808F5B5
MITNLRNWIAGLLDLVTFLQGHGKFPAHEPEADLRTRLDREPGERLTVNLAVREILGETRQLRTKLLVANTDLFNEYDRAVGEAEFRKNAAYALVGLTAVLNWHHSPWWALLLVFIIRLYSAGVSSERVANDVNRPGCGGRPCDALLLGQRRRGSGCAHRDEPVELMAHCTRA